jgi:putative nucleotidyltransferase with HDIG domain
MIGTHLDISARKEAELALRESLGAQEAVTAGVIEALVRSVEARDPFTAGHQRRVSELVVAMARRLGLDEERVEGLRVAGLLHDVGKITIPAEILSKPGRLTAMEFELIKGHAAAGHEILKAIPFPWEIAEMTLQHHEREDGSGYPAGLKGEAILPEARLLAVADVVEAMASHRPYRPAPGIEAALAEIREGAGTRYDAAVVAACEQAFAEGFAFG